ncbi:MAG: 50S ribosomal protein L10 [Chlamydiae bacterium]|nr:50S ribosomal protein L10 [Chlamydiota bacterium]
MRKDKQLLLDEIKGYVDENSEFVITRYQKMDVTTINDFRRELTKKNAFFEVVKKRILAKALNEAKIQIEEPLQGHIGVVFTKEDATDSLKTITDFAKGNKNENLELLAGFIDGKSLGKEEMVCLSKLPGKDQLRAQFLGVLSAPMTETLGVMQSLLTSIMILLENKIKKESKQ